jgi:hypothetical protein
MYATRQPHTRGRRTRRQVAPVLAVQSKRQRSWHRSPLFPNKRRRQLSQVREKDASNSANAKNVSDSNEGGPEVWPMSECETDSDHLVRG